MLFIFLDFHPATHTQAVYLQQRLVVVREHHVRLLRTGLARREQNDLFDHLNHRRSVLDLFGCRQLQQWQLNAGFAQIGMRSVLDNGRLGLRCCALEALEGLHMQHFQLAEEFAGRERIERGTGHAFAQRLEQAGHQLQQTQTRLWILVRGDTPDQLIHGLQRSLPFVRLHAMLEASEHQHLAPGFLQQPHHHFRQGLAQQPLVQCMFDLAAGQFGFGAAFLGVTGTLLQQFTTTTLIASERHEFGQQLGEDRRIINEIVQQTLHHLLDLLIEAVTLRIVLIDPTQRGRGDFVEQAARRMAATAEEGLVQHRHLEHRDLQTANQCLERIRQSAVIENELEQHRHQIDHIFIDLANHPRLATLGAGALEQSFELVAKIEIFDGDLRRGTLLHVR